MMDQIGKLAPQEIFAFILCRLRLIAAVVGAIVLGTMSARAGDSVVSGQAIDPKLRQGLLRFVSSTYIHGVPFGQSREFADSSQAPSLLLGMLGERELIPHWANIVVTLGYLGRVDKGVVEGLVQFLKRDSPLTLNASRGRPNLSTGMPERVQTYNAKSIVPLALGYILCQINFEMAGRGKPLNQLSKDSLEDHRRAILRFLTDGRFPWYWEREGAIQWRGPYGDSDRNIDLAEKSIQGLGMSGDPDALKTLKALKTSLDDTVDRQKAIPPEFAATDRTRLVPMRSVVKDAIQNCVAVIDFREQYPKSGDLGDFMERPR